MANGVHATDLNAIVDRLNKAGRRDANNLALADQIQFSSILRTLVDTPEQTLEVVAAATQAREADKARPDGPEREHRVARRTDRERNAPRDAEHTRRHEPKVEPATVAGLKPVTAPQESDAPKPTFEFAAPVPEHVEQIAGIPMHGQRIGLETGRAPEAVAALVASRTAEPGASGSGEEVSAKSQALLINAARSIASGALADHNFSRVGEDLHDATMHRLAQVGQRAGGQTAANSLKQEQEVDLASRLGLTTPVAIQVDTQDPLAKMRAMPMHSLSGSATMAQLDGLQSDSDAFGQAFGRNAGENAGTELRAPSHGALLNDRALAAANMTDFNQMLRAQGALLAAQQGGQMAPEAKPVLAAEVTQINGVGAPSGPSQVSQTAKANPTTAARQPERPQAPAEQISVKIRQAVEQGLDKINIKLNPAHLGRVEVRLDIKDGHISATVLAERAETLDLLQKDARGLERALLDAGLRTDITSLSFGLRGDGQKQIDLGRDRRQGTPDRSGGRMNDAIERDEGIFGAANNQARNLRSNGGVDIRV